MIWVCDKKRHLVCLPYTVEKLHEMADKLNLKRCWFHKDHYDIPKRKAAAWQQILPVVESKTISSIIRGHLNFLDTNSLEDYSTHRTAHLLDYYSKKYDPRRKNESRC